MKKFSVFVTALIFAVGILFTGCPQPITENLDKADVADAKSSLAITFASGDTAESVTQNITLPTTVGENVSVYWDSDNPNIISDTGIITRPAFKDGDVNVLLTATLTKNSASDTKTFTVKVKAIAPYSYTVTFDSQDATTSALPAVITVTEPATKITSLPSVPVKTGYIFGGWFTEVNGNGIEFTVDSTVTQNITVYAKWTAIPPADTSASDVANAKSSLVITFASGDTAESVTQDVTLPTDAANGVSVSWSSNNTSVISNTGTVVRPSYETGDKVVTLTATLTKNSTSDTKTFTVTVKANAYVPPADVFIYAACSANGKIYRKALNNGTLELFDTISASGCDSIFINGDYIYAACSANGKIYRKALNNGTLELFDTISASGCDSIFIN